MKSLAAVLATPLGMAVIGVAVALYGSADDAPGVALLGMLLIAGAFALGARAVRRRM